MGTAPCIRSDPFKVALLRAIQHDPPAGWRIIKADLARELIRLKETGCLRVASHRRSRDDELPGDVAFSVDIRIAPNGIAVPIAGRIRPRVAAQ